MQRTIRRAARGLRTFAAPALAALTLSACDEDPLRVQVTQQRTQDFPVVAQIVAPDIVPVGTQVGIGLQLQNPGATQLTLPMLGVGQQYAFDVQVFGPAGNLVWQLMPAGTQPPTTTTQLILPAGGFFTLPAMWDMRLGTGFVPAGTYTIQARALTPTGAIVAPPRSITVTP